MKSREREEADQEEEEAEKKKNVQLMVVSTAKLVSFFYEMNLIVQCSVTFSFFSLLSLSSRYVFFVSCRYSPPQRTCTVCTYISTCMNMVAHLWVVADGVCIPSLVDVWKLMNGKK